MTEAKLIWKYLTRTYNNDHPIIYQYVTSIHVPEGISSRMMSNLNKIFTPMDSNLVKSILKQFLDHKRKLYHKGQIEIKSMY